MKISRGLRKTFSLSFFTEEEKAKRLKDSYEYTTYIGPSSARETIMRAVFYERNFHIWLIKSEFIWDTRCLN